MKTVYRFFTNLRNMNKTKINTAGLLLALIFILPLFQSSIFINKVITPKLFFFFFYLSAAAFIFLLKKWNTGKYNRVFKITLTDILVAAFPLYCFLRTITYENGIVTDQYLFSVTGLTVFYFLVKELMTNQNLKDGNDHSFNIPVTVLVITGTAELIWGLLQLSGKVASNHIDFKITGSFDNPGPYAAYLASVFPAALYLLLNKTAGKTNRIISLLFIAGCTGVLPTTGARASWLGVITAIFVVVLFRYRIYVLFKKKYILVVSVVILTAVFLAAGNFLYHYKVQSSQGRLFIWKNCITLVKERPLAGHGFNSYPVQYNNVQENYFRLNPEDEQNSWLADNIEYAFNEYLQITVELGIAGLIIFLAPVIYLSLLFFRKKDREIMHISMFALLMCIILMAFVTYPFRNLPVYLNYYFALAVLSGMDDRSIARYELKKKKYRLLYITGMVLIIVFSVLQIKRYKAQKKWKAASAEIRGASSARAQKIYREIYPLLRHDKYFLYNYGAEFSVLGNYKESVDILEETTRYLNDADTYIYLANSYTGTGNLKKAEQCLLKASCIMPGKFYPQYRLVLLYDETGRKEEALILAKKLVNKPVKVSSSIVENIRTEMQRYIESAGNN